MSSVLRFLSCFSMILHIRPWSSYIRSFVLTCAPIILPHLSVRLRLSYASVVLVDLVSVRLSSRMRPWVLPRQFHSPLVVSPGRAFKRRDTSDEYV